jgi:hypothetical protein
MTKLLNNCKNIILGLAEGIQMFKAYKVGKVK